MTLRDQRFCSKAARKSSASSDCPFRPSSSVIDDKVRKSKVLQTPRCSFAQQQAQYQTQVVAAHMDHKPFQNIVAAPYMQSSHCAGFVAVGEWPFQHQSSAAQQGFAASASDSSSIGINRITLGLFANPLSFAAL